MLQFDEYKVKLNNIKPALDELAQALNLPAAEQELDMLNSESAAPGFWDDLEKSQKVTRRMRQLENKLEAQRKREGQWDDLMTLCEMGNEEEDDSLVPAVETGFARLEAEMEEARLSTLLTGEYDSANAILTIHAGAGGTEAQDWAQMLYRMYTRWAERHDFTYQVVDYLDGDEVMPEIPDDVEVDIRPEDIEMQVYRSSGAGGQHINKTSSAVRLIHKPTGVVVACQTERSQFQNKDTCMRMLRSKLVELKMQEHAEKISDIKGVQLKIEWGSQIRSYVFMPYQLVKDNRTAFETSNINAVMDGELDGFINAYLTAEATGNWATK